MQKRRRSRFMDFFLYAGLAMFALVLGRGVVAQDWRTASREPTGLAPDPATTSEAVVQVYAARTWGWKGSFGVHTWVAVKPPEARGVDVAPVVQPLDRGLHTGLHGRADARLPVDDARDRGQRDARERGDVVHRWRLRRLCGGTIHGTPLATFS